MTERTLVQKQPSVVIQTLPLLAEHSNLAIKGGVAINYFHRDFPRYSVDLDLAYLPLEDRNTAFSSISKTLRSLKSKLQSTPFNYPVTEITPKGQPSPTTLRIDLEDCRIVI